MSIDPQTAASSLSDVERVEQRTREAVWYFGASTFLFWWGGISTIGNVFEHFEPLYAAKAWAVLTVLAFIGSFVIARSRRHSDERRRADNRILYAQLILVVFGLLWTQVLGTIGYRELDAFWPTLWMFGFMIAGLWVGRFFVWCGMSVTLLTIAGYYWAGNWFEIWMAVLNGAALIGGGFWLRRIGVARS
ncbi:MAG TPA: hypothetical protein VGG27_15650 [Magnetospirillaceae bacterium]